MANEYSPERFRRIFAGRITATKALCEYYAALALQTFRQRQSGNEYWNNKTSTAYSRVYAEGFIEGDVIGWFIAHAVEYGVYLELANDRKHEALRPIVMELEPAFMRDLKRIWE